MPIRIDNNRLSDETKSLTLRMFESLRQDLRDTPVNGVQITLDNYSRADEPPTIDVRYV